MTDVQDLNEPQRRAVLTTEGPLLVLAGAGSGKTRVLTRRIAHLISELSVSPASILAITFTNKAAAEMRERIERQIGPAARGMWVMTFHAMCVRMLRADAERLGYTRSFTIYDEDDKKRVLKTIASEQGLDTNRFPPGLFASRISSAKNELAGVDEVAGASAGPLGRVVRDVFAEYRRRLFMANAMDFDDLLVNAHELLNAHPEVLGHYRDRFRYVHVDEYQDTNHAQYRIVSLLAGEHQNLMVVGDDDQSIYGWRGADIRNILEFEQDFPNATVVRLEENYRSTASILGVANTVVAHNSDRKPKELFTSRGDGEPVVRYMALDEHDEVRWMVGEVERLLREQGYSYRDVAVFYRTHAQSRVIEDVLLRTGTPYRIVGGTKFFERAEIRDVLAYLRVVVNRADEVSLRRIVNTPRRGIGDTTVGRVSEHARREDVAFVEALTLSCDDEELLGARARDCISDFLRLLGEIGSVEAGTLRERVERIVELSGLLSALRSVDTQESLARVENVMEFFGVVEDFEKQHEEAGLAEFMEWVSLRTDLDELADDDRAVTLMTVHNAKGLEFPIVFMVGMEQGIFPHANSMFDPASLEEERRLCYVGVTRAKDHLHLSHAEHRTLYGQRQRNAPSAFFDEMPPEHMRVIMARRPGGRSGRERARAAGGAGRPFGSSGHYEWEGRAAGPDPEAGRVFGAGTGPDGADDGEFETGDRIEHRAFGSGRVVAVEGDKLVVDFDDGGLKDLLVGYAPIKKVG
jgi:DNA helicase-2/ATP-dependent DNA helicase PcrA